MHMCLLLYKFSLLRIFSIIASFLHLHAFKFIAIVEYYHTQNSSSTTQFSPIPVNLGVLIPKGVNDDSTRLL